VSKPRILAAGGALALALAVAFPAAGAQAAAAYPVVPNIVAGIADAVPNPAAPPAGADVTGCHSAAHPIPVVLVNGTFANAMDDFGALAPTLANAGYCVYTFSYGAPSSRSGRSRPRRRPWPARCSRCSARPAPARST
jgi:hypothetical protein